METGEYFLTKEEQERSGKQKTKKEQEKEKIIKKETKLEAKGKKFIAPDIGDEISKDKARKQGLLGKREPGADSGKGDKGETGNGDSIDTLKARFGVSNKKFKL